VLVLLVVVLLLLLALVMLVLVVLWLLWLLWLLRLLWLLWLLLLLCMLSCCLLPGCPWPCEGSGTVQDLPSLLGYVPRNLFACRAAGLCGNTTVKHANRRSTQCL
jgi:hypothetical protein